MCLSRCSLRVKLFPQYAQNTMLTACIELELVGVVLWLINYHTVFEYSMLGCLGQAWSAEVRRIEEVSRRLVCSQQLGIGRAKDRQQDAGCLIAMKSRKGCCTSASNVQESWVRAF